MISNYTIADCITCSPEPVGQISVAWLIIGSNISRTPICIAIFIILGMVEVFDVLEPQQKKKKNKTQQKIRRTRAPICI